MSMFVSAFNTGCLLRSKNKQQKNTTKKQTDGQKKKTTTLFQAISERMPEHQDEHCLQQKAYKYRDSFFKN